MTNSYCNIFLSKKFFLQIKHGAQDIAQLVKQELREDLTINDQLDKIEQEFKIRKSTQ